MIRKLVGPICTLLLVFAVFANMHAHAAMPPHGPYAKDCRPDSVRAVVHGGVTIAFDCFSSDGDGALYGSRIRFSPSEERFSTGGARSSALIIFVSAAADCPAPHDGSAIALSNPCILVEETVALPAGGLAFVNTCGFKSSSPMTKLFPPQCNMGMRADDTAGSITFTHWSPQRGGQLAFTFSPNARLTEFIADIKAVQGESETTVQISGAATVTLE